MYSRSGKCPYNHNASGDVQSSLEKKDSHVRIRRYVEQFQSGALSTLSLGEEDFNEKQQALFAYRIFQFSQQSNIFAVLQEYANMMVAEPTTYKKYLDEMKVHLQTMGEKFFRKTDSDNMTVSRLVAGLDTFHAFIKRVPLVSYSNGEKNFPYKLAVQLASTSLERANILAQDPDIEGWKGLFFDKNSDISQMYLGIPINRPVYKCPVLYSGEFRTIIDEYYRIVCFLWENSIDKPKSLDYF